MTLRDEEKVEQLEKRVAKLEERVDTLWEYIIEVHTRTQILEDTLILNETSSDADNG